MSTKELSPTHESSLSLRPELPTVPDAFMRADYEGWLEKRIKRFQLKCYQKTQAERLEVLRQINQIQTECLTLMRHEADWKHFQQEDRLRQKRLDLEEMNLDQRMEDALYERATRLRERSQPTPATPKKSDLVDRITAQLDQALRTEAGIKAVLRRAREEHPELKSPLDEWEARVTWDLRERKWF